MLEPRKIPRETQIKFWESLPKKEWDEFTPISSLDGKMWFYTKQEVIDFCKDQSIHPTCLFLVHSKAWRPEPFSIQGWVTSQLPEDIEDWDGDIGITRENAESIDKLVNAELEKMSDIFYVYDNKFAVSITSDLLEEYEEHLRDLLLEE